MTMKKTSAQPGTAQEITLKVRIDTSDKYFTRFYASTGKLIAEITNWNIEYRWGLRIGAFLETPNTGCTSSYPEAVEQCSDAIEAFFAQYGINVEFVKE